MLVLKNNTNKTIIFFPWWIEVNTTSCDKAFLWLVAGRGFLQILCILYQ
jgi:hypothetical protein